MSIWGDIKHAAKKAAKAVTTVLGTAGGDFEDNADKQDDEP